MSLGCGLGLAAYTIGCTVLLMALPLGGFSGIFLVLLAPAVWILLNAAYGCGLLFIASVSPSWRGVRGLLVYSNSPTWQSYIEENWIPRLSSEIRLINWSERSRWRSSLAVRIFRHFVGDHHDFNPSFILFQGLRAPVVFRFFYAFRDFKHGNEDALKHLEGRLFEELARPGRTTTR